MKEAKAVFLEVLVNLIYEAFFSFFSEQDELQYHHSSDSTAAKVGRAVATF